ncbi:hypothetical protein Tco_1174974 [Tanacetum coccineum]
MFYTSQEEIALNVFCRDQVKPLLNELLDHFDGFQNLFQRDIKEMKDAFEQNDVYLDEIERQNDLLKDQLLEVSLKHDIELCVLLSHECVDESLHDELEQVKKKSLEIQEGLKARIKILEIQKLEDENVSLDFKVQSLIKERDNAKMEYKKLFDSIKKTRSQTQKEMDELITHVSEKTYAYGAIRAENQLLYLEKQALNNALVPREQRLRIGNYNYKSSTTFKPKEPTFQIALDVLSLTPFYQAFLIFASVPAIYMHEFWATVSFHKQCIFKLNKKNHSFDLETFRDMLQICPNLPGQKFVDPPFEEKILDFIIKLGYSRDIKSLSDVKKNVDYAYLLWEDLVYQIKNKESKKNKDMYYPRFTKVIINHFMLKDQSIPRRNKVDWHMAKDDPIHTIMRFIPKHETVQKYGAILPDTLTNQAMKESDAYKTYYDFATRKVIPKQKYVRQSTREKTDQALKAFLGKRLKATAKVVKSGKKKLPAQGLETLSEIALSEADQMKLITKRSKTQFHSSHTSGSGANEEIGVTPGVPDVPTYGYEDEQISWKSSDEDNDDEVSMSKDDDDNANNEDDDDQEDDNEQTESDNDGDDFVHPKFSTHDEEERQDEEDKEEEWSDDEAYDEVTQERRDTKMTYALQTNIQVTQVIEDTHVIITAGTPKVEQQSSSVSPGFIAKMLNPILDTGIDSILNLNTESTSLVDVPVTTHDEIPPSSVTTLPPPPIPLIQPLQQTPVSTTTIVPSSPLQNLPTFGSLFKFEDRVKSLENDFSTFKQTNLFAEVVSSIPGIVDKYLANQMNEAIKAAVQLQSDRLREEAQAKKQVFINKIDENMKKIIKEQVKVQVKEQVSKILSRLEKSVNEQLKAEVLIRSSNEAKTSHVVAANLSELELKNFLIDKLENNKSIDKSESKRRKAGKEPESNSAPKNKTSKSTNSSKEGFKSKTRSTSKSAQAEEQVHTVKDLEEPAHQEFNTGFTKDQPTLPAVHGPIQPWINTLARNEDPRESFNELIDTPLDFSAFIMNWLKVDTLTLELLAGLTFELMKGSESACDVYSKNRIIAITKLKIVEWHNYKHLDWITIHRNDDKLYTFKEGDYKRLRLQDIEDMLLLLVQGKLKNLTIKERLALSVSLRMFTRIIVIKRGFIYQNNDKKNRLMRIDGTLNDVRSDLDDILKRIRMEYLPQTVWRNVDMERAGAMIQANDQ